MWWITKRYAKRGIDQSLISKTNMSINTECSWRFAPFFPRQFQFVQIAQIKNSDSSESRKSREFQNGIARARIGKYLSRN